MKRHTRHVGRRGDAISRRAGYGDDELDMDEGVSDGRTMDVVEHFYVRTARPFLDGFRLAPCTLRRSVIHGRALFDTTSIRSGAFVREYGGERVSSTVTDAREVAYEEAGVDWYMMAVGGAVAPDNVRTAARTRLWMLRV